MWALRGRRSSREDHGPGERTLQPPAPQGPESSQAGRSEEQVAETREGGGPASPPSLLCGSHLRTERLGKLKKALAGQDGPHTALGFSGRRVFLWILH